jgi:hypothetical protein
MLISILTFRIRLFMQIFTTVAAPSTIAFIVQDLGDQPMSAWVLQVSFTRDKSLVPTMLIEIVLSRLRCSFRPS